MGWGNCLRSSRYLASVFGVGSVVLLFKTLTPGVNLATIGFTFLIVVLICASAGGLGPGILASFLGMLAYNLFFIPPINQLLIEDPQNWVALFAFLATAITTSRLSAVARRRALEAERRSREISSLYKLSCRIILDTKFDDLIPSLQQQIEEIFDVARCEILVAGDDQPQQPIETHGSLRYGNSQRGSDACIPLRLGSKIIGSLLLSGTRERMETLEAIGNLVAIMIERKRAFEQLSYTEALKRNEELKSALLDSVTHSLKTPLTSIKASVTSLLDQDLPLGEGDRYELLSIIDEETDRMNHLVQNLIEMARIDAGELRLTRTAKPLEEIIRNSIRPYKNHNIHIDIPSDLPPVLVDPLLIGEVIANLVDNAIKYSPPSSAIEIKAVHRGNEIITSVIDRGCGIPDGERAAIFEKFYRAKNISDRSAFGMGMGLAICRGIVQAHGGRIWVESALGRGSVFSFAIPLQS